MRAGMPRRVEAVTSKDVPCRSTEMCARSECSASMRTAFLPHGRTAMTPPKLFTDNREPVGTENVVSVCAVIVDAVSKTVARVMSITSRSPLRIRRAHFGVHGVGGPLQNADLALHLVGE